MKLSIVIPAYNEAETIRQVIDRVRAAPYETQIIVVDDASTDATSERLDSVAGDGSLEVIRHTRNLGKGAALRTGFARVTGDIVIIQDADLEYDPQDYPKLLEPLLRVWPPPVGISHFGAKTAGVRFPRAGHRA